MTRRNRHVVGLFAGLGNQLFQYCWAERLTLESGIPSRFDTRALRSGPRELGLPRLGIALEHRVLGVLHHLPCVGGRVDPVARLLRQALGPRTIILQEELIEPPDLHTPSWWYGYWQRRANVIPVLDNVRRAIRPIERSKGTLAVHVRRDDFVADGLAIEGSYFQRAVSHLRDRHPSINKATVYSDDPAWCHLHLDLGVPFSVNDRSDPADDLLSLAGHEYLVLTRGTFGWWASHLVDRVPGSVVIPEPYVPDAPHRDTDLIDPDWLRVPAD